MALPFLRDEEAAYLNRLELNTDIRDHMPALMSIAQMRGGLVLELGVRSGNSTAAFLAAASYNNGWVTSVDLEEPQTPPEWAYPPFRWTFIQGDTWRNQTHAAILHALAMGGMPPQFDVLFIDSSHEFEHTLHELVTYSPLVRPGGAILCHDTELDLPVSSSTERFPVARALDRFCELHLLAWHNRCTGIGDSHGANPNGRCMRDTCNGLGIIWLPE